VQLPEPRIWLVHDPNDLPESTRELHALADLERGVIVVRVTPGPMVLQAIALDLLTALGKDHTRHGILRAGEENWRRGAAWLSAEQVGHLIIDRAELLKPDRWRDFIGLAAHCGQSLWLIVHGASLTRGQRDMPDDWPITEITYKQFITPHAPAMQRPGDSRDVLRSAEPPTPFPTLPRSDFTTFRADCHALLSPEAFARVEVELADGARRMRRWLADAAEPDVEAITGRLRELIEDCLSTGQAVSRLRGAQAVGLMNGLLVRVDLERLAASTQTVLPRVDRQLVRQLRGYSDTHIPTIALLACLTGASPEAMTRLNVSDVTEDAVRVDGRSFAVPAVARCVLAAHIHRRLGAGALSDDALFADQHRGMQGQRNTVRALRTAINRLSKSSGLMLWCEYGSGEDRSRELWLQRRGVSMQVLR